MDSKRTIGALAAGVALLGLLFLDLGGGAKGIDIINYVPFGVTLILFGPLVLGIIASLSTNKVFRGFGVGIMAFFPIAAICGMLFGGEGVAGVPSGMGIGMALWLMGALTSTVFAFMDDEDEDDE